MYTRKGALLIILLIVGLSSLIYPIYESNYVQIIVDKALLNDSYKAYLFIVMPTPYNIYHYSFEVDSSNNVVRLDLDKPLSDFKKYYELHGYLGDYIIPTLTINLLIYNNNGGLTVRRLVYDPLIYYLSKYGIEAFNKAIRDPYSAFKGRKIYFNSRNTYTVYTYKPSIKHINTIQNMIVSKSTDYFLVLKPGLKPLYNSKDNPPDEWFQYINVKGGDKEDVIKNLWNHFALQYSIIQYYNTEYYSLDYILEEVIPSFGHNIYPNTPTLILIENYLQDLASMMYGDTIVIDWEEENREYTLELAIIGANVSYKYEQPIQVLIGAMGNSFYYCGWVFNDIPIFEERHWGRLHGIQVASITPGTPNTAYIVVPTRYKYLGSGLFINIKLDKAVVNGTEYWVIDPVFVPIPYYVKLISNFDKIYATRSYDPELLENLTWSKSIVKIFSSTVTGNYPQPDSNLPQRIYSRHIKDENLMVEKPGIVTSVAKWFLFTTLKYVMGRLLSNSSLLGYLLDTAANIGYMEFSAKSTTLDTELLIGRISFDNLFANMDVYMATLNTVNESGYTPLMIMYNITIDKPYILSGVGIHRESIRDIVEHSVGLYAYAEAMQSNYSESMFIYKLVLSNNTNITLCIEQINGELEYNIYPSGKVILEMKIDLYSEDGRRLYHDEKILFGKTIINNSSPLPIHSLINITNIKAPTVTSALEGVFYLVISFKAIAESYGGYTYLDIYYDNRGLEAVILIELSENT